MSEREMWKGSAFFAGGILVVLLTLIGVCTLAGYGSKTDIGNAIRICILLPLSGMISFQFGFSYYSQYCTKGEEK